MVYFFRVPDGRIKIGTTTNLIDRLSDIRRACGKPVAVLAVIPGWEPEEHAIHECFDHLRHLKSEFFAAGQDLLGFIENLPDPVLRAPVTHWQSTTLDYRRGKDGHRVQRMSRPLTRHGRHPYLQISQDPGKGIPILSWKPLAATAIE